MARKFVMTVAEVNTLNSLCDSPAIAIDSEKYTFHIANLDEYKKLMQKIDGREL